MKFMMLMIPAVYQGGKKVDPNFVPDPKKMEQMGRFNDEMGKALRIESLNGLHPQITGARVSFGQGKPTVTDGPYIETKEVLGGYWMVEAPSKEEVVKWAQRCPAEPGDTIEIRQIFEAADLAIKKRTCVMKYICLGYIEDKYFGGLTTGRFMDACFECDEELQRIGHFIGGEVLQPTSAHAAGVIEPVSVSRCARAS